MGSSRKAQSNMMLNPWAGHGIHVLLSETRAAPAVAAPARPPLATSRITCILAAIGVSLFLCIVVFILVLVFRPGTAPRKPLAHDCLALMQDESVVVFLDTTQTAYRTRDGGMTWSRDATIEDMSMLRCSWTWPVTLETNPPIGFYAMESLGLYQSLDDGETLTSVPLDLADGQLVTQAVATRFDTLIVSVRGGELWLRLPGGGWIRYTERSRELAPEPE